MVTVVTAAAHTANATCAVPRREAEGHIHQVAHVEAQDDAREQ